MNLAERVIAAMAHAPEVSQADLARACRVKPASVNDWRSGKTKQMAADTCLLAAAALGVRPEWLAGLGGEMVGKSSQAARLDVAKLTAILEGVELGVGRRKVPAKLKARAAARFYAAEGPPSIETIQSTLAALLSSLEEA